MTLRADSPYGAGEIGTSMITDATNLHHFGALPLSWMYMQEQMSSTEKTPGVFDWSELDKCIPLVHNAGIRICYVLQDSQPQFKVGGLLDPKAVAAFATALLKKYPGQIQAVIAGNESFSHTHDAASGFALLDMVYPAVKAVDKSVLVGAYPLLNGKRLPDIAHWWKTLCQCPYFDFGTLHYYPGPNDPLVATKDGMPALADFLTAYKQAQPGHGMSVRDLWITEFGWTAENTPTKGHVTPEVEAAYLSGFLKTARLSGVVSHVFWFGLHGLYLNSGPVRPAYTVLQNEIKQYPLWTAATG